MYVVRRIVRLRLQNAMADLIPVNRCHRCGCTAYKPVIERNAEGAMTPCGRYQCAQCGLVFASLLQWRGEGENKPRAVGSFG